MNRAADQVLVVSEGFLLYLSADAVAVIARDLHMCDTFSCWITDVTSPLLLRMNQVFSKPIQRSASPMRFAPSDNQAFFEPCGWNVRRFRPLTLEGSACTGSRYSHHCCGPVRSSSARNGAPRYATRAGSFTSIDRRSQG
jgi:hypothetical protein